MAEHVEIAPGDDPDDDGTPRELLERQRTHLLHLQAAVERTVTKGKCSRCGTIASPQLLRESANLSRAAAIVSAELRQRDKHEQEMDRTLSAAELGEIWLLWLEDAPIAVRKDLIERAQALGDVHLLAH